MVSNGECGSSENIENDNNDDNQMIVIVVLIVLSVVVAIAGYCIWKRMNKSDSDKIKHSLATHNGATMRNTAENEEIEVEVSMERGINQTTTYD